MKRNLFQLFNLLMACIVLLSSTGFGLVEHSCQMRGKRTYASTVATPPCQGCPQAAVPMQKEPTVKKTDCCKEDQRFENVDFTSSLSHLFAKFIKTVTETVSASVVAVLSAITNWLTERASASVALFSNPPPRSGRDILTLMQTLLL